MSTSFFFFGGKYFPLFYFVQCKVLCITHPVHCTNQPRLREIIAALLRQTTEWIGPAAKASCNRETHKHWHHVGFEASSDVCVCMCGWLVNCLYFFFFLTQFAAGLISKVSIAIACMLFRNFAAFTAKLSQKETISLTCRQMTVVAAMCNTRPQRNIINNIKTKTANYETNQQQYTATTKENTFHKLITG